MQVKASGTQMLKVLCGSRAYGLEDENSDYDYHHVFVLPTNELLRLDANYKETNWVEGSDADNTGWELKHFLSLATHCNPTILETFVAPVVETTPLGDELRALFPYVLKRDAVYNAFRGYAHNQRKKMFEPYGEDKEKRMIKAAIAYLRSLIHGYHLLRYGTYQTKLDSGWQGALYEIKQSTKLDKAYVISEAEHLEEELLTAYKMSQIPEHIDMTPINEFLLKVRKENW